MITPSHIIYSWALARKSEPNEPNSGQKPTSKRTLAFVLGALFPDTPTYLFFIVCGLILGYSGEAMWDDMYFNSGWSIPITLFHSFWLWPVLIGLSTYFGLSFLRWFSISAFFHALVDFLVHTDDAYRHFWLFSDWKFHSPVSYYRASEYGNWVSAFDSLLVLGLLTYLYTKYTGKWRVLIIGIGLLYTARLVIEPIMNTLYGS
jgi:hypothetical protein